MSDFPGDLSDLDPGIARIRDAAYRKAREIGLDPQLLDRLARMYAEQLKARAIRVHGAYDGHFEAEVSSCRAELWDCLG